MDMHVCRKAERKGKKEREREEREITGRIVQDKGKNYTSIRTDREKITMPAERIKLRVYPSQVFKRADVIYC